MQISQNQYKKLSQGHKMIVYLSPPEDDDNSYMPPDHNIIIINSADNLVGKSTTYNRWKFNMCHYYYYY